MFTKNDYVKYFDEILAITKDMLSNYTDLVNELDDRSIRSKMTAFMTEDMEAFKFAKAQIERFS